MASLSVAAGVRFRAGLEKELSSAFNRQVFLNSSSCGIPLPIVL